MSVVAKYVHHCCIFRLESLVLTRNGQYQCSLNIASPLVSDNQSCEVGHDPEVSDKSEMCGGRRKDVLWWARVARR